MAPPSISDQKAFFGNFFHSSKFYMYWEPTHQISLKSDAKCVIYRHSCWAPFWPKIQIGKKWKIWKVYWKCHYFGHFLSYRKNKDSFGILITTAFRLSTFIFKIHSPSALKMHQKAKIWHFQHWKFMAKLFSPCL